MDAAGETAAANDRERDCGDGRALRQINPEAVLDLGRHEVRPRDQRQTRLKIPISTLKRANRCFDQRAGGGGCNRRTASTWTADVNMPYSTISRTTRFGSGLPTG